VLVSRSDDSPANSATLRSPFDKPTRQISHKKFPSGREYLSGLACGNQRQSAEELTKGLILADHARFNSADWSAKSHKTGVLGKQAFTRGDFANEWNSHELQFLTRALSGQ
jgi:hypothetical protein